MNSPADSALRILEFWRDVETFNIPTAPSDRDSAPPRIEVSTYRKGKSLPWKGKTRPAKEKDKYGYIYDVYVGVADTEDLCSLLLQTLFPGQGLSEGERERLTRRLTGNGWLASFQVDEHGHPQAENYISASFIHGVDALRQTGTLDNIDARLARAKEEFAQRCHPLDSKAPEGSTDSPPPVVTWAELDTELEIMCGLLGDAALAQNAKLDWRVVVCKRRFNREFADDTRQSTLFLNSFFLDDLDRLIQQACTKRPFGKALTTYLGSALAEDQRIDIMEEHAAMSRLVSAAHLPSARWSASSQHPLVLAQQAAVAHVLHTLKEADGVLGINGPPGTGKTTLLCDIIAQVITDRAERIAALKHPIDLFDVPTTIAGKKFFPIKPAIVAGSSIVVTSTNNNAVKNITQELPARKKVAEEYGDVQYFAEVMNTVFAEQKVLDSEGKPLEGWGIIAAALGNRGNRYSFAQGFFRDEYIKAENADEDEVEPSEEKQKPPTMKQLLEEATRHRQQYQGEWEAAKDAFIVLQTRFKRQRAILIDAEKAALRLDENRAQLQTLQAAQTAKNRAFHSQTQVWEQKKEERAHQLAMVHAQTAVVVQIRESMPPSLWDRLLGLFGRETPRMATRREALANPAQELGKFIADLSSLDRNIAQISAQLKQEQADINAQAAKIADFQKKSDADEKAFQAGLALGAQHFPDARFWSLSPAERHRASIAVSPALDKLRAEIFLQAMELHRLTILANAGKFLSDLRAVRRMLIGELPPEQHPIVWDAFFFVVPVISTTLASFDRLFEGMGQDSLGWLLVDEAGQATPQSIAGALWRSRRAVIVGDPQQIEPVFTVPHQIVEELRQKRGVAPHWSPADLSAQSLADRITPFGSWIADTDTPAAEQERQWTGMPLRTHRRCDDPMFSVSNNIAYAGQMVQGRVDAKGEAIPTQIASPLGESAWFDVRSRRVQHPVSIDEIDCLIECLKTLKQSDQAAKVYVISPFRKVAQDCSAHLKQEKLKNIDCGTVHTFQGKEADIVFLVLGTAPSQKGAGARAWAASKANLLNVAITRAKSRLYVIADASQWRSLNYFRTLHAALPVREVEPPQEAEVALAL
jgi:hypothetical protein